MTIALRCISFHFWIFRYQRPTPVIGFSFQAQKQSTCQPCDSIYYYHQYYLSFRTILVLNKGGGGPGVPNRIVDFGRQKRDKKVLNVPRGRGGVQCFFGAFFKFVCFFLFRGFSGKSVWECSRTKGVISRAFCLYHSPSDLTISTFVTQETQVNHQHPLLFRVKTQMVCSDDKNQRICSIYHRHQQSTSSWAPKYVYV